MKKITLLAVGALMLMLISGCGYCSQFDNFENSKSLRLGMTQNEVRAIMGEPLNVTFAKPDVWFYYIKTRWHDGQTTIDECMPVVFKDGKLAGWGSEYYNREIIMKKPYSRPTIEGLK